MNKFVIEIIFVRLCCAGNLKTVSRYVDCGLQKHLSGGVIRTPVKVDISKIELFHDKELSPDMIEFLLIPNNQLYTCVLRC